MLNLHKAHEEYQRNRDEARVSVVVIGRDGYNDLGNTMYRYAGEFHEIIYMDTGSRDRMALGLAEELGAKVYQTIWDMDFARARNEALQYATGTWILSADCDDIVTRAEARHLNAVLRKADPAKECFFVEMELPSGITTRPELVEASMNMQCKVFPNLRVQGKPLEWYGRVHEQIVPDLQKAGLVLLNSGVRVVHTGYTGGSREEAQAKVEAKCRRNRECLMAEIRDAEATEKAGGQHWRGTYVLFYHMSKCAMAVGVALEALEWLGKCTNHPDIAADPPQHSAAWRLRIQYLSEMNEKRAALDAAVDAEALFPDDFTFPSLRGLLLAELQQIDEAIEALEKAANMDVLIGTVASPGLGMLHGDCATLADLYAFKAANGVKDEKEREAMKDKEREWRRRGQSLYGQRSNLIERAA